MAGIVTQASMFKFTGGPFDPLSLNPYIMMEADVSMLDAGDAEATYHESVKTLPNLANGVNAAGDAVQATAANQPIALPLINGEGYLYCPKDNDLSYASFPDAALPSGTTARSLRIKFTGTPNDGATIFGWGTDTTADRFSVQLDVGKIGVTISGSNIFYVCVWDDGAEHELEIRGPSGGTLNDLDFYLDGILLTTVASSTTAGASYTTILSGTAYIGQDVALAGSASAAIKRVLVWDTEVPGIESAAVFDVDFTDTNVEHGATSFGCATGQTITVVLAGENPATIIRKPCLRFDGLNDFMEGAYASSVATGVFFIVFHSLGRGGFAGTFPRIFCSSDGTNSDSISATGISWLAFDVTEQHIFVRQNSVNYGLQDIEPGGTLHATLVDGSKIESRRNGLFSSNAVATSLALTVFRISQGYDASTRHSAMDLQALYLFPASITSDDIESINNYLFEKYAPFSPHIGNQFAYTGDVVSSGATGQWYVDGVAIPGEAGIDYTVVSGDIGSFITQANSTGSRYVEVTPAYDADALEWIKEVMAKDDQPLEVGVQDAMDQLVVDMKAGSVWTPHVSFTVRMGARTLAAALLNVKNLSSSWSPYGFLQADYNRITGLNGDGVKYLLSDAFHGDLARDSRAGWEFVTVLSTVNGDAYFGNRLSSSSGVMLLKRSSATALQVNNTTSGTSVTPAGHALGLLGTTRSASNAYSVRGGQTNFNYTHASAAVTGPGFAVTFYAANKNGSIVNGSNHKGCAGGLGSNMSLSTVEACLDTYIASVTAALAETTLTLTNSFQAGLNINNTNITDRTQPCVFACDLTIPASPSGMIFEMGGATGGYIGFRPDGSFIARCGVGSSAPTASETDCAVVYLTTGQPSGTGTLTWEFNPTAETIRVWWNGVLIGTGTASVGFTNWTGTDSGAFGTGANSACAPGEETASLGAAHHSDLRYYENQTLP